MNNYNLFFISSFSELSQKNKITGQKRVPLEDYKDETIEIDINYQSPKMVEEKNRDAKFYWSEKMRQGYERYFEIEGNTRRYFTCRKKILWINRLNHIDA